MGVCIFAYILYIAFGEVKYWTPSLLKVLTVYGLNSSMERYNTGCQNYSMSIPFKNCIMMRLVTKKSEDL